VYWTSETDSRADFIHQAQRQDKDLIAENVNWDWIAHRNDSSDPFVGVSRQNHGLGHTRKHWRRVMEAKLGPKLQISRVMEAKLGPKLQISFKSTETE
jgi:hypothetical protein